MAGAGLAGLVAVRSLAKRRRSAPAAAPDPASELRQKLAESRTIVDERDEFESAELTVDLAEPAPPDPDTRRRAVHESARETVERMRRPR